MKRLISSVVVLALTSAASAIVSEDFEDAGWQPYPTSIPANGWSGWLGGTQNFVDDGIGYLGSAGITHSGASGTVNGATKGLGGLITTGVQTASALVNVSANTQTWATFGWIEGGDNQVRLVFKPGVVEMVAQGKPERQVAGSYGSLGWFEAEITYDMDNDFATARYRDIDDAGIAAPGTWVDLGFFGDAGTPDTNITGAISSALVGTGNTNGSIPGSGVIDNFNTPSVLIPEPAGLAMFGLGAMLVARRRRLV